MSVDGQNLAMALRRAYKTMHRKADSFFAKHGVTADQYVLLYLLAQESEVTQENLVARASSDPNTVRRMLVLLEGRRFVIRRRHPTDERARSVSLTSKGRKIYERLQRGAEPFRRLLLALFDPKELKLLQELLARIPPVMSVRRIRQCADLSGKSAKHIRKPRGLQSFTNRRLGRRERAASGSS